MCDKLTFMVPELGQSPCQTILMLKIKMLIFEAYPSSSGGRDINLNGFCFVQTGSFFKSIKGREPALKSAGLLSLYGSKLLSRWKRRDRQAWNDTSLKVLIPLLIFGEKRTNSSNYSTNSGTLNMVHTLSWFWIVRQLRTKCWPNAKPKVTYWPRAGELKCP